MDRLEYAIKMERDTERFYRELINDNGKSQLRSIFAVLADEEKVHVELLSDLSNNLPYVLYNTHSEIKNIFDEIGEYKDALNPTEEVLKGFNQALKKEEECLRVYREYLASPKDENEKEVFQLLSEQEIDHIAIIQRVIEK